MTSATGRRPDGPGEYTYEGRTVIVRERVMMRNVYKLAGYWIHPYPDGVDIAWRFVDDMPGDFLPLSAPVAMPQPDWNEAPEWAQWWAVEYAAGDVGLAFWFAGEPVTDYAVWVDPEDEDRKQLYGTVPLPLGCDWRTTLRQRPEASDAQHCTD